MSPPAQRPPAGNRRGAHNEPRQKFNGECTASTSVDEWAVSKLYRVRWYRPGWQRHRGGGPHWNVRYFLQPGAAERFGHKLGRSVTQHSPTIVEISEADRGPWEPFGWIGGIV